MGRKFIKGGRKLDKFFRDARHGERGRAPKKSQVGFFPEDKHEPTGLPVAEIAAQARVWCPR